MQRAYHQIYISSLVIYISHYFDSFSNSPTCSNQVLFFCYFMPSLPNHHALILRCFIWMCQILLSVRKLMIDFWWFFISFYCYKPLYFFLLMIRYQLWWQADFGINIILKGMLFIAETLKRNKIKLETEMKHDFWLDVSVEGGQFQCGQNGSNLI